MPATNPAGWHNVLQLTARLPFSKQLPSTMHPAKQSPSALQEHWFTIRRVMGDWWVC